MTHPTGRQRRGQLGRSWVSERNDTGGPSSSRSMTARFAPAGAESTRRRSLRLLGARWPEVASGCEPLTDRSGGAAERSSGGTVIRTFSRVGIRTSGTAGRRSRTGGCRRTSRPESRTRRRRRGYRDHTATRGAAVTRLHQWTRVSVESFPPSGRRPAVGTPRLGFASAEAAPVEYSPGGRIVPGASRFAHRMLNFAIHIPAVTRPRHDLASYFRYPYPPERDAVAEYGGL